MSNQETVVKKPIVNIAVEVAKKIDEAIKKSPTGVSFVSVKGYVSSKGEKSNALINIGISRESVKGQDIEFLKQLDVNTIDLKLNELDEHKREDIIEALPQAKEELLESLIKPNVNKSNAQKNAYERVKSAPQIKVNKKNNKVYLEGYVVNKKVLAEGEYKYVNSAPKTLAKNAIKKLLKASKIRQYNFEDINNLVLSGNTIEFIDNTI